MKKIGGLTGLLGTFLIILRIINRSFYTITKKINSSLGENDKILIGRLKIIVMHTIVLDYSGHGDTDPAGSCHLNLVGSVFFKWLDTDPDQILKFS